MLTQPLEIQDYNMEKEEYDGTKQYARNKRQQICIMQYFADAFKQKGLFVSMHPGWVDTPAVRTAMPDFYAKMKDSLKQPSEGADTINHLSVAQFHSLKNGEFYFDRQIADKHLTISLTGYSDKERSLLIKKLQQFAQ